MLNSKHTYVRLPDFVSHCSCQISCLSGSILIPFSFFYSPCSINLGINWKSVISFCHIPLYLKLESTVLNHRRRKTETKGEKTFAAFLNASQGIIFSYVELKMYKCARYLSSGKNMCGIKSSCGWKHPRFFNSVCKYCRKRLMISHFHFARFFALPPTTTEGASYHVSEIGKKSFLNTSI